MAKMVYVGSEYKEAFDSICRLIKGDCFEGSPYKVLGNRISDGIYEYELSNADADVKDSQSIGFFKDGASWFKGLRGEYVDNDDAIWTAFIEKIDREYHKGFSVVEYKKPPHTKEEKEKSFKTAEKIVERILKRFLPYYAGKTVTSEVGGADATDDIYGVSMKLDLSGGTGAALPVLAKLYFAKGNGAMLPMTSESAKNMDEVIRSAVPEDDGDQTTLAMPTEVIDETLNAVEKLLSSNQNVALDYFYFGNRDEKAITGLLNALLHDSIELECQKVDVLYVTHFKTDVYSYNVSYNGKRLFNITVGVSNEITMKCLNCLDSGYLIERNEIKYVLPDGKEKTAYIDPFDDDLGISDETRDAIMSGGEFSKHFIEVSCPGNVRNTHCSVMKCASQLFAVETNGKQEYKCKDCPYPEIVYKSFDGTSRYTPSLTFISDGGFGAETLVGEDSDVKVSVCKCCGRKFSATKLRYGLCPSCYSAENGEADGDTALTYKKYRQLLPLFVRALSLFSKKKCVEDDEIIVFYLGNKKYVFNKLNADETGTIKPPVRVR